jgi:sec-independent protein translocase protein TatA
MFGLRMPELLLILLVLVLLFGVKKLPQLGDSLGKGIRAFKRATDHGLGQDEADASAKPQHELPQKSATTPTSSDSANAPSATKRQDGRG